jgi:hypothetical protein
VQLRGRIGPGGFPDVALLKRDDSARTQKCPSLEAVARIVDA